MFGALVRRICTGLDNIWLSAGFQIARRDKNGLLHCVDGPALIYPKDKVMGNGYEYYIHGNRHREDGPAVVWENGHREYWINGKLHREDGPAIDSPNYKAYWVNGEKVTVKEVTKEIPNMLVAEKNDPPTKINSSGKHWLNKFGRHHRINGPAFICVSGLEQWYINGKLHREDGPAYIMPDGSKYWYLDGISITKDEFDRALSAKTVGDKKPIVEPTPKDDGIYFEYKNSLNQYHREDGPAVKSQYGLFWYLNGKLHRLDGPAELMYNGYKAWYKEGEIHREDGPACEWADGRKMWYRNGRLHREDGPACEYPNSENNQFYLKGEKFDSLEKLKKALTSKQSSIPPSKDEKSSQYV